MVPLKSKNNTFVKSYQSLRDSDLLLSSGSRRKNKAKRASRDFLYSRDPQNFLIQNKVFIINGKILKELSVHGYFHLNLSY